MASATLHWLLSWSVFLVCVSYNVEENDKDLSRNGPNSYAFNSSGIRVAAMLPVSILGSCLILPSIFLGCRKISSNIPVAASFSLALAAAAHRPAADPDAASWPVKWGKVPEIGNEEVGYCCVTNQGVVER